MWVHTLVSLPHNCFCNRGVTFGCRLVEHMSCVAQEASAAPAAGSTGKSGQSEAALATTHSGKKVREPPFLPNLDMPNLDMPSAGCS